jgi:hypothetical protein
MTTPRAPAESGTLKAIGLVCPILAVTMAAPFTFGALGSLDELFLVAPTLVGLLAAPGYLWALLGWRSIPRLTPVRRWWARLSFAAVLAASLVGAVFSLALILPSVACLLILFNGLVAWRRLEARPRAVTGSAATVKGPR